MNVLIINKVIKGKGLTIVDVAKKLGVTRETVQRQIRGNPSVETLQRYAEVLEVDITELFRSCKKEEKPTTAVCPHCGKQIRFEKAE